MGVECIHGLDEALCDLCTPKPIPKLEASAPTVVRPRTVSRQRVAGAAGPSVQSVDQRIYHLTHIQNLAAILDSGCLLADTQGAQPVVDISSADNREDRRAATINGVGSVADFVPFFVTPDSAVWLSIRSGSPDPRLTAQARQASPAEFVVLVTTVGKAGRDSSVVAVGDAADAQTRFATTPEQAGRELGRMRGDDDLLGRAELLVAGRLPFEAVTLIGVANDRARNEVREMLSLSDFDTKVSIYPPWFARP